MDGSDFYQLLDMHGHYVCHIDEQTARSLLKDKYAYDFGTKRKIHGFRLTVPLHRAMGTPASERSLTVSSSMVSRFVFKEKIRTRTRGTQTIFRLKPIHVTESPEWGLKRILTAPAIESAAHTLISKCSEEERRSNPGRQRRQDAAAMFRLPKPTRRRNDAPATSNTSAGSRPSPVRPVVKPVSTGEGLPATQ